MEERGEQEACAALVVLKEARMEVKAGILCIRCNKGGHNARACDSTACTMPRMEGGCPCRSHRAHMLRIHSGAAQTRRCTTPHKASTVVRVARRAQWVARAGSKATVCKLRHCHFRSRLQELQCPHNHFQDRLLRLVLARMVTEMLGRSCAVLVAVQMQVAATMVGEPNQESAAVAMWAAS